MHDRYILGHGLSEQAMSILVIALVCAGVGRGWSRQEALWVLMEA
jgi:hypothetical protein